MICSRSYDWFLNFLSKGEGLDCFLWPKVLLKANKITVTCRKLEKINKWDQL